MLHKLKYLSCLLIIIPALASSHGPARVKVAKDIEINASPEAVWAIVTDICSIKDWNASITDCSSNGNEVGSKRDLTLDNGEKITEKMSKIDENSKRILSTLELEQGRIIKGMPIATLGTFLTVSENGSGSKVELKGAFYRAFPGQEPPPDMTDDACKEAVLKMYTNGLEGLKQMAEAK